MKRIVSSISLLCAMLLLVGCRMHDAEEDNGHRTIAYLQSICRERSVTITEDIYIEGYVVANDKLNELGYAAVVDDGTAGIEIKIDSDKVENILPQSSFVRFNCSGLSIGREGARLVLGESPTAEYVVDRLREDVLYNHIAKIEYYRDIPPMLDLHVRDFDSRVVLRYVRIDDIEPVGEELGESWCDRDSSSATGYMTTIRHYVDGCDTLRVVTLGKCDYAAEMMPMGRCSLAGVLDWYDGDYALRVSNHHIFVEK